MEFAVDAYEREILAFRAAREARYRSEEGWLTLIDRIALEPGDNQTPLGAMTVGAGDRLTVDISPDVNVMRDGAPVSGRIDVQVPGTGAVVFAMAGVRYEVARRGERLNVRVRDPRSPARLAFTGIPFYPIDPGYRVVAEFARLAAPALTTVETSDGGEDEARLIGEARFRLPASSTLVLQIFTEESTGRLYVPFADATSREETYGGGRFLYGHEDDGELLLDFNRASNPPCAFNPLVTCPLPPPANRLSVPVRAGERLPRGN